MKYKKITPYPKNKDSNYCYSIIFTGKNVNMITKENKERIICLLEYMQQEFCKTPGCQNKVVDISESSNKVQSFEEFYLQHFSKEFKIEEIKICMELLGCYKNDKEKFDYKNILNQTFQNNSKVCQIIKKVLELIKF